MSVTLSFLWLCVCMAPFFPLTLLALCKCAKYNKTFILLFRNQFFISPRVCVERKIIVSNKSAEMIFIYLFIFVQMCIDETFVIYFFFGVLTFNEQKLNLWFYLFLIGWEVTQFLFFWKGEKVEIFKSDRIGEKKFDHDNEIRWRMEGNEKSVNKLIILRLKM